MNWLDFEGRWVKVKVKVAKKIDVNGDPSSFDSD